jgi:molecular chaperone DnaK
MRSDQQEVWGRWATSTDRPARPDRDPRIDEAVTDYSNSPRDSTRVPLAHRIQLKFDRFSGFINEYISNISPGGIFIRTDSPELPGQLLDFEFRLGDGYELIRGRGQVVWARERGEGPERPPGMGVRFLELSAGSKDLIYKIVDDYSARGGKPFDLTPPAAAAAGVPASAAATLAAPSPPPPSPPLSPRTPAASAGGAAARSLSSPSGAQASAGAPALPWTLEIPAIRPLPGVPAITPRSPLESLGAGAGSGLPADAPPAADEALGGEAVGAGAASAEAAGGRAAEAGAAGAEPAGPVSGSGAAAAAGKAADPWAEMAATLPPLDELAPEVPALALTPPIAPAGPPASGPETALPFSSFDLRAPRRRSRLPLIGFVLAVVALGLAAWLLRDSLLAWIEKREQPRAEPTAPPPLSSPRAAAAGNTLTPASAPASAGHAGTVPPVGMTAGAGSPGGASPAARSGGASSTGAGSMAGGATGARTTGPSPTPVAAAESAASRQPTSMPGGSPSPVAPAPPGPGPRSGAAAAPPAAAAPAGAPVTPPAAAAPSIAPPSAGARTAGAAGPTAPAGSLALGAAGRVTAVERITWEASPGGTDVVLWGNGDFFPRSYSRTRVGGLPVREVIKIAGITRPFPSPRLLVRTPELVQIRTGYHPPQELHVVLDLGSRDVEVGGIEAGPRQLRLHLRAK